MGKSLILSMNVGNFYYSCDNGETETLLHK